MELFTKNSETAKTLTPLSKEQIGLLFDKVKDKRRRAIIALGVGAGISLDELVKLKAESVDYPNACLNIWTSKGIRKAKVSNKVLNILKEFELTGFDLEYPVGTLKNTLPDVIKEVIGEKKSWTALRTTFVIMCKDQHVPIEIVLENTGASLDIVYGLYHNGISKDFKMPDFF